MVEPWNKGHTKNTHPSVRKISETMSRKRIDNFANWRSEAKRMGKIPRSYPVLTKNGDLAELIGVILGNGHIEHYPRTEALSIFSNANNPGFVQRYKTLIEKIFGKTPTCTKHSGKNCIRIRIYQKDISKRLNILAGKIQDYIAIPRWISSNKNFSIRYLRGLYEAEGSLSTHEQTYTHKLLFSNRNQSMLTNVERMLKKLGFHPHRSPDKIQISRKEEVYNLIDLLQYKHY